MELELTSILQQWCLKGRLVLQTPGEGAVLVEAVAEGHLTQQEDLARVGLFESPHMMGSDSEQSRRMREEEE